MRRIAIIGGGIAGLTAAYEISRLARSGVAVEAVLFESSPRPGGVLETIREGGFIVETGADAWLTAKPAARELALELGLADELIHSNDATRKTWILLNQHLVPMPDGMSMMVPSDLDAIAHSPLFTPEAIAAYRAEPARAAELRASAPPHDESIAAFTLRHFGPEVLDRVAAPLLSGVFGGNVSNLSVRAVMPAFVQMERDHGSLITALQSRNTTTSPEPIFTTLRSGLGTLVDRLVAAIPPHWLRLSTSITALTPPSSAAEKWQVSTTTGTHHFDSILLATPVATTAKLLHPIDPAAAQLLPTDSSSAVLVAFAFADASQVPIPPGFGLLVPPSQSTSNGSNSPSLLQACTFADQKFPHRVPPNGRLLRAFFGGAAATRLSTCGNDEIAAIARAELTRILHTSAPLTGPTPRPLPAPVLTSVRRLPASLPQYAVGHLDRVAQLEHRLRTNPALANVALLGNAFHGVGIPDVIRQARQTTQSLLKHS